MTQTTKEAPKTNIINPNWILLDTCPTISSIRNKSLLQNIQPCGAGEEIRAYTNGGHQYYDHTATLKLLPFEVFLNEQSLANILSFAAVASKFRITLDTELDQLIKVHLHHGTRIIFNKCGSGLYYFDKTNEDFQKTKPQTTHSLTQYIVTSHAFTEDKSKSGQSNNITATLRIAVYTNLKRIHTKEPNQKLSNHH